MNAHMQTQAPDTMLTIGDVNQEPVIVVRADGSILWRGKEVESDDQFRAAMLDLAIAMRAMSDPAFPAEYVALRNSNTMQGAALMRMHEERVRLLERIEALTNAQPH